MTARERIGQKTTVVGGRTEQAENSIRFNPVAFTIFFILMIVAGYLGIEWKNIWIIPLGLIVAGLAGSIFKIANQWEKAVVLRLGKLQRVAGPGLFLVIPIIESIAAWIDQRIMITYFAAEQALSKDNVPVNVDAILFWVAWDPEKAALEVSDYKDAVSWAAQTALREMIGKKELSEILGGREFIDEELCKMIDERTEPWGVSVQSVEIRDVIIPEELQDAMSREAQAERERRARVILGAAESEISVKYAEASRSYLDNPVALKLRSMNLLYECLKERGGLVVVPSEAADAVKDIGNVLGVAAYKDFIANKDQPEKKTGNSENEKSDRDR